MICHFLLGNLPDPGIQPPSPALQVDSLPLNQKGSPCSIYKFWLFKSPLWLCRTPLVAQRGKRLPAIRRPRFYLWVEKIPCRRKQRPTPVLLPGKTPWVEEPGRLQSTGSQRFGHDWATSLLYLLVKKCFVEKFMHLIHHSCKNGLVCQN